uniref:profilin-1 n=1 Tax=Scatophagus argus TaxID=75038 RepID=UPI001ED804CA|nr:profilin-1 [Scatophagus argus]
MSWDAYITNLKTPNSDGTNPVMEAAICGIAPGQESVWASTDALKNITVDEIKKLAGDRSSFRQAGPTIAGTKCMLLTDKMEEEGVYSLNMKTKADACGACYSVCVGKSNNAIVIAQGTKEANGGQLTTKVYGVVKHLRDANM